MKTSAALATLIVLPFALAIAADEPSIPAKPKSDPAQTFKLFDRNSDGAISLGEYKSGMSGQMDAGRIEEIFKKKDSDGDGKLTLPEFMFVPPKPPMVMPTAPPADGAKKKKK